MPLAVGDADQRGNVAVPGAKAGLDVAQAFPASQLGKRHRQKLIPARKTLPVVVASITGEAWGKLFARQMLQQLCEDGPSEVPAPWCRLSEERSQWSFPSFPFQIVPERNRRQAADAEPLIHSRLNFPRTGVVLVGQLPDDLCSSTTRT